MSSPMPLSLWGRRLEDRDPSCSSLRLDVHDITVGWCPTGDASGWRCDLCGNDDGGAWSWVAACPSDVDGPVRQWVCLCWFLAVTEKSELRAAGPLRQR